MMRSLALILVLVCFLSPVANESVSALPLHTNTWAVIVCTSRYWFNYRHIANALAIYHTVRRLGLPDERIILMLAEDVACNLRNPFPGQVFVDPDHRDDLYDQNAEIDYRGEEVTVDNFLRLLTGRHGPYVPLSKRLMSDEGSNILFYLAGHGGDNFLKFQDSEEISSQDLADAFEQMHQKRRYREIFFMVDTCQAATLHRTFYSPHILSLGSSLKGESSYSLSQDMKVGVSTVDRFTYHTLQFLKNVNKTSQVSIAALLDSYNPQFLMSHPELRQDLFSQNIKKVPLTAFFSESIPLYFTPKVASNAPLRDTKKPRGRWEAGDSGSSGSFSGPQAVVTKPNRLGYSPALGWLGLATLALTSLGMWTCSILQL